MKIYRAMPILEVNDVEAAMTFYHRLGFANGSLWGEPASFGIARRGDVTLGLRRREGDIPIQEYWAAYIYVEDATALHEEFTKAGLNPSELNRPTDYRCIDFDIVDPHGHRLAFGQDLEPTKVPGLGKNEGAE